MLRVDYCSSSDDSSEDDDSGGSEEDYDDEESSYESSSSSDESFSSCSSSESILQNTSNEAKEGTTKRIAVMVNVPPHQVPDGVLNLVRSHRPFIEHVLIVIGSSQFEEAE